MKHGRPRPFHPGFPCRLVAALLLLAAPCIPRGLARGGEEEGPQAGAPRPASRKKGDLEWLSLGQGLVRVREKYSAAAVLYEPPADARREAGKAAAGDPEAGGFLADHLADTATRGALRKYVLIRLDDADLEKPYGLGGGKDDGEKDGEKDRKKNGEKKKPNPGGGDAKEPEEVVEAPPGAAAPAPEEETVAARLALTAGKPALVLLSFREEVVRRFDGELPARSKLRKELSFVTRVNDIQAREARRVEPEVEASRYAFKLGKTRDAVLKVLPFEEKGSRLRMDKVLTERLDRLLEEYKAKAKDAMAEGDRLDRDRKHEEAIKAFDRAQREFPFPEVIRQANRRKSEILRKMVTPF